MPSDIRSFFGGKPAQASSTAPKPAKEVSYPAKNLKFFCTFLLSMTLTTC
jgi:hypothetical protein